MTAAYNETPRERLERLIMAGRITRESIEQAERVWQAEWQEGILLPTGEVVRVSLDDVFHAIVDGRIARAPVRIEAALSAVFEIRRAGIARRLAFSRWQESGEKMVAAAILSEDGGLRSIHVIDEQRLERYRRAHPEVLWQLRP